MSEIEEPVLPLLPLATKTLRLQPGDIVPAVEDSPYVVHFTMAALDPLSPADKKEMPSTLRLIRIEDSDEEDEDEEQTEQDTEPVTLLTLGPTSQFQQPLDLYIAPTEALCFQVVGSYPIHLTGNIVDHPISQELIDAEENDSDDEEDDEDIPDAIDVEALDDGEENSEDSEDEEDELDNDEEEDESDEEDEECRTKEVHKKTADSKKRAVQDAQTPDKKKVKFSASLEKGPDATESKFPTKKLEGGVIIEDRKLGEGPSAKKGSRISMRYVGKLANGKVFDKNTSGKPFSFGLGRGEVIRGWDIGIAGMKAGGERRIIIPAPMAYGKQSLPGIPKNSELRFDVKCLSLK